MSVHGPRHTLRPLPYFLWTDKDTRSTLCYPVGHWYAYSVYPPHKPGGRSETGERERSACRGFCSSEGTTSESRLQHVLMYSWSGAVSRRTS